MELADEDLVEYFLANLPTNLNQDVTQGGKVKLNYWGDAAAALPDVEAPGCRRGRPVDSAA